MNCDESRRHWEIYHDSEGDSELYLRVNDHLTECSDCSKWFFQQAQFEELVTEKLAAKDPTPELWDRILTESRVVQPAAARSWTFFTPLLAVAASLLVVVGIWQWTASGTAGSGDEHLSALTAAIHHRLTEASEPIEFVSSSDSEVEAYLRKRVSFPVRCPPRKDAGFAVRGGGVCTIAGDMAAYVVGLVDDREVSVFILPEERLAQFTHERDALQHRPFHHCREGDYDMVLRKFDRNILVAIGSGTPEELERVIRAYGSYPHEPDHDPA